MICNVVRMSLVQYTDVHKLRISTIYGRRQYTDVYNIRTLTIYGRSASPYIVNVRILSSPKSKSVYCKRPYIEKIAVSQDIVNCASPYIVTQKTIYGLANVRILFFDHCDVEANGTFPSRRCRCFSTALLMGNASLQGMSHRA